MPTHLLIDPQFSEAIESASPLSPSTFVTKLEAAQTVKGVLDGLPPETRERFDPAKSHGEGLWIWLALFYFDQLCPADGSGTRALRANPHYRYIGDYAPFGAQRAYRHLLAMPCRILLRHGPELSKGLLAGKPHVYFDHFEQVASRQNLWNDPGFLKLWHEIYFDASLSKWDRRRDTISRPWSDYNDTFSGTFEAMRI